MFIVQIHGAKYHVNITLDMDELDIISAESKETGGHKAAKELEVPDGTIYCWIKAFKEGRLSANEAVYAPKTALSIIAFFHHLLIKKV